MNESNRPESLSPDKLQYHPKSIEIYGEPDPSDRFVEDVRENGVEQPITVTEDSHFTDGIAVISGNKRTEAADRTNQDLPIGAWKEYDTPEDEVAAVLRYNDYRDKSFSQRMGEANSLKEIEEAAAEGRMQNPMQNFAGGDGGLTRDKIAERVGFGSGETYRKASKVWKAAQDGDNIAQDLVEQLDREEESIHGAYTSLRAANEFEIPDGLTDCIDQLRDEGRLSGGDIRALKMEEPPSVIRWLSTEKSISPLADGTIPYLTNSNDVKWKTLERVEIDYQEVVTNTGFNGVTNPGQTEHYRNLRTIYEKHGPPQKYYSVAPDADGQFHLLDPTLNAAFEAAKNVEGGQFVALVKNVDAEDMHNFISAQSARRKMVTTGRTMTKKGREKTKELFEDEVANALLEIDDRKRTRKGRKEKRQQREQMRGDVIYEQDE